MADNARGTHSAPNVYTREIEVAKNKKSLGITTLGLVGETLKGPAFEPIAISDWKEFKEVFGGKSVEKFKGTKFPKYELPYIAESYIEQSQQLQVVRVLGLSGYNAGPAWLIVDNNKKVIAVLRSRGEYEKFHKYVPTLATDCKCGGSVYDHLRYFVGEWDDESYDCTIPSSYNMDALKIGQYISLEDAGNECAGYTMNGKEVGFAVNSNNYGVFCIYGTTSEGHYLTKEEANKAGLPIAEETDDCNENSKYFLVNGKKVVVYADFNGEYLWKMNKDEQTAKGIKEKNVGWIDKESGCMLIGRDRADTAYFANSVKQSVGYFKYGVSLNPADKNYILNVIGTKADNGSAPIFCESLYDVSLLNGINEGTTTEIKNELIGYNVYKTYDYCGLKSVFKFVPLAEEALTKKQVGIRYLIDENTPVNVHPYNYNTNKPYFVEPLLTSKNEVSGYTCVISDGYAESAVTPTEETFNFTLCQDGGDYDGLYICKVEEQKTGESGETISSPINFPIGTTLFVDVKTNTICVKGSDLIGQNVVVKQFTLNGVRHYFYTYYTQGSVYGAMIDKDNGEYKGNVIPLLDRLNYIDDTTDPISQDSNNNIYKSGLVKLEEDGYYYRLIEKNGVKAVVRVTVDVNDYKSSYRFASTPWIVSNAKGDRTHIDLHKLFRFHTITDGDTANEMFKVSIFNIRPDEGLFSVGIRDINDTDASPIFLEKFSNVNLVPTSKNYIAYKIGSYDGTYERKSRFVTIEVNEDDVTRLSVPCGFVGYPINFYNGYQVVGDYSNNVIAPTIPYNTEYYKELKNKKQYFGCSDLSGVDVDVFTFKGDKYYNENDPSILSNGFHLDCRLNAESYTDDMDKVIITVDGIEGYNFTTINSQTRTDEKNSAPIIATEQDMEDTIYSDVDLRKFTCYFYGGFDGWDVYREERTNGDDFTRTNYKGRVATVNDEGVNFKGLEDSVSLGLKGACITSDYYAYLAGYRQLANPSSIEINLLATPCIDYVNQNLLVKEVIDMVETERQDTLYIVTTPDKKEGADDSEESMYTPEEVVENLEDSQIDSTYVATYYPWVKYLDKSNNSYIFLPPTKDVVRNMAQTDNQQFEWYAPAGKDRGPVDCVRAKKITKLEEEDTLYDGRINYLRTFAKDGVRVWGQKTLYNAEDDKAPLTRIGVRRLMLAIRRRLVNACMNLIFDPLDTQEKEKADSLIRPIMQDVKKNRGCVDFAIEYDESEEARERLELPIKVWVKPTLQLEYVPIDFMITPQDADFSDLG